MSAQTRAIVATHYLLRPDANLAFMGGAWGVFIHATSVSPGTSTVLPFSSLFQHGTHFAQIKGGDVLGCGPGAGLESVAKDHFKGQRQTAIVAF